MIHSTIVIGIDFADYEYDRFLLALHEQIFNISLEQLIDEGNISRHTRPTFAHEITCNKSV